MTSNPHQAKGQEMLDGPREINAEYLHGIDIVGTTLHTRLHRLPAKNIQYERINN